jgi:hypothetical protein
VYTVLVFQSVFSGHSCVILFATAPDVQFLADESNPKSVLTTKNASGLYFLRVSEATLRFKLEVREHCNYISSRIVDSVSATHFLFDLGAFLMLVIAILSFAPSPLYI